MMTSWQVDALRITGHLWGEYSGHHWIPSQRLVKRTFDIFSGVSLNKAMNTETLELALIWDAMATMWRHYNVWGLWPLLLTWFNFNPSMDK